MSAPQPTRVPGEDDTRPGTSADTERGAETGTDTSNESGVGTGHEPGTETGAAATSEHRSTPLPAPDMAAGVTEVHGTAEDLQGVLFAEGTGPRPAAEGFEDADAVAAAVEGAATSMEVSGGVVGTGTDGAGGVRVDTTAIAALASALSGVATDLCFALAGMAPLAAELELWSLSGQPQAVHAAALAGLVAVDLLGVGEGVAATGGRLLLAQLRYAALEDVLTGAFSRAALDTPLGAVGSSVVREVCRTAEDVDVALARAGIGSPEEFGRKVEFTAFGVVVRGGGPRGTDALIRGIGLDDIADAALRVPLGGTGSGVADDAPDGTAPGPHPPATGAADTGAAGTEAGRATSSGGLTLGQYLRFRAVEMLSGYGRPEGGAHHAAGGAVEGTAGGAAGAGEKDVLAAVGGILAPVVAALMLDAPGIPRWYTAWRTGRRLRPAEVAERAVTDNLRPWLTAQALKPATREVFTALTPANAAAHRMTGMDRRALPAGIENPGTIPTTVAGTAAALKDAKNIVSGAGPDGTPVENSTVMVQKAVDEQGRRTFSVVLTGTEEWVDSPGVHDLKGIAEGMTARVDAPLTELPQAQRMAVQALQDAGIQEGDAVVLSGHSLGGIDAAGLAANTQFRERYYVEAVTTYGAPVGDFAIPESTSVMAVEHVDDVVPALDGVANPDSGHRSTVRLSTAYPLALTGEAGFTGVGAHDMNLYAVGSQGISQSHHPAVAAHEQRLADVIPHGPGTRTETYVYEGWEEH